jgi:hypothetical protein
MKHTKPIQCAACPGHGLLHMQMSGADFELRVQDGGIYWGSDRVSIKGVNWFGFETADFALHGLW